MALFQRILLHCVVILLAYKRYVHRQGKRHGPYYYKNVRDESGKVKSVYLGKAGEKGKKPLKATIFILFLLLMLISGMFFLQNRAIVISKITSEENADPIEIDQILIKVLIRSGEFLEKELRVMNVGPEEKEVEIEAKGLDGILKIIDNRFSVKPGQTKIVRINFSTFDSQNGIEQAPGVYIGKVTAKTGVLEKQVPVIVEVESKEVLFDMNLNPVARDRAVTKGESTTFEIRVFNLKDIESYDVDMDYFVKDINGNTIISENENVVVKTQASFFKTLRIPENLRAGNYVFVAKASFGESIGTASYLFDVQETEGGTASKFIGFCRNDPLCWSMSIIFALFIFTLSAYIYFFIGAYLYRKIFGISPATGKAGIPATSQEIKEKKTLLQALANWRERRRKSKELRLKRKIEFEKEKLKLKEQKEVLKAKLEQEKKRRDGRETREKEELEELRKKERAKDDERKSKLRKERLRDIRKELTSFFMNIRIRREESKKEPEKKPEIKEHEEIPKGSVARVKKIIEKGYKSLEKENLSKAERLYDKLMHVYVHLHPDQKIDVFKDIDSFYKSLVIRKHKRKHEEDNRKVAQETAEKIRKEQLEKEKARKEEKLKERSRKTFEFLHGLGLVKTEEEKSEIRKRKELEKARLKREKAEAEKKRQEETKRREKEKAGAESEKRKLEEEEARREEEEGKKTESERGKKEQERLRIEDDAKKQRELELRKNEFEKKRLEEEKRRQEEEERSREEKKRKQRELAQRRLEEQKIEEKEEEERKKERDRQLREEGRKKLEEEERRKKDILRKKEDEEKRRKLLEKERLEAQRQKEKELEIKKKEEEKRLEELERRKQREAEGRKKAQERRMQEEEERKEQEEKERKLQQAKSAEERLRRKEEELSELKAKAREADSQRNSFIKQADSIGSKIEELGREKGSLFRERDEGIKARKELQKSREESLAQWKARYDEKSREKADIGKSIQSEFENEVKQYSESILQLSPAEKKDHEKWKRLELRAKYKLEEKSRERALKQELDDLLNEKKQLESELRKQGPVKTGKDILNKGKEIDSQITECGKDADSVRLKIKRKESEIKGIEESVGKEEAERARLQEELLRRKKELGGLSYVTSLFSLKKAEPKIKEPAKEQKKADEKIKITKEKTKKIQEEPKTEEAKKEEKGKKGFFGLFKPKAEEMPIKEEKKQPVPKKPKQEAEKIEAAAKPKGEGFFSKIFGEKAKPKSPERIKEEHDLEEIEKEIMELGVKIPAEEKIPERIEAEKSHRGFFSLLKKKDETKEIFEQKPIAKSKEEPKPKEEKHDIGKDIERLGKVFDAKEEEKKPGVMKKILEKAKEKEAKKKEIKEKPVEKAAETAKPGKGLWGLFKKKDDAYEKAKSEFREKTKGKSRKFAKCHEMIAKAHEAADKNDTGKAKSLYLKTREMYTKLEYAEKKETYDELMKLYNRLSK